VIAFVLGFCSASIGNDEQQRISLQPVPAHDMHRPKPFPDSLQLMINALDVMQDKYFELWQGVWPAAIDWTSAVLGTYLSAALTTLSSSLEYGVTSETPMSAQALVHENIINRHFSQLVSFYFGQDAFALRTEAYDDMLWVVLGWLESIKFINVHSALHYQEFHVSDHTSADHKKWHGKQWISSFAHRARIFWDLASQGWDTSLCNGGMIWSPYMTPYKNAITNELYITASISMYLYFPGDQNTSPFLSNSQEYSVGLQDPKYLAAAIEGYKWLQISKMRDDKGLYVDGFHISGWDRHGRHTDTQCDARNEMVYTYNQGVLLSGQRGLWEATAARSYLEDGHELIRSVINATGYNLKLDELYFEESNSQTKDRLPKWHGIGRRGILEEACDAFGYCGQDAQTFKGIFFHHFTLFCAPLPPQFLRPGQTLDVREFHNVKIWHKESCATYAKWIRRNAEAAMGTKDTEGKFGTWWGASKTVRTFTEPTDEIPHDAVDYRNRGIPKDDDAWGESSHQQKPHAPSSADHEAYLELRGIRIKDVNDRGRGRTVETQGGGLAVLRALWEIVDTKAGKEKA